MFILKNKEPKYNDLLKSYVLNFHGRVNEASVKNFQLTLTIDPKEKVLLQFGKAGENRFHLDFKWPFSP